MSYLVKPEEPWFQRVAEAMIRQSLSYQEAILKLGIPSETRLTLDELMPMSRRKTFVAALRTERHNQETEIANDPGATKQAAIGALMICASRLMESNAYDKAAEVWLKIARMQGWVGAESTVNVFQGLKPAEYSELQRAVRARMENSTADA